LEIVLDWFKKHRKMCLILNLEDLILRSKKKKNGIAFLKCQIYQQSDNFASKQKRMVGCNLES